MAGLEKLAFDLGRVIMVQVAKMWLGAHQKKASQSNDLLHLIGLQIPGLSAQRSLKRELESIGDRVGERLTTLIQREYRDLDDPEVTAAMLAVMEVVQEAKMSDRKLFESDLDPHKLAMQMRKQFPDASSRAGLSASARSLYGRMLDDVCLSLVQIIINLPAFTGRAHVEALARLTDIGYRLSLVLERTPLTSLDAPLGAEHDKEFERMYLKRISEELDRLELFGIRMRDHEMRPTLTVAYLNLTASDETKFAGPVQKIRRSRRRPTFRDLVSWTNPAMVQGATRTVRVPAILSQSNRTLIRGEAGHGKTTLLQWLAISAARRQFSGELESWNGCIPFFIRLRHWTEGDLPAPESFVSHFSASLGAVVPKLWTHRVLASGRALLLVDGVDEVAAANRKKVRSWLSDLLGTYPDIRVVVTSRPAAATNKWLSGQSFTSVQLHPMTAADVGVFIDRWHEAVKRNDSLPCAPEMLPEYRRALMAHLAGRPKLRELATSPLLCAMLCALNLDRRKQLPQERLELYRAALDMLIERRDAERGLVQFPLDLTGKISVLQNLAWRLSMNGRSELAKEEAEQYAEKRLASMPNASVDGTSIVQHLLERSGVIREPVDGRIDFIHRTFQEYLTAKEIADEDFIGDLVNKAHLDQWWHVAVMAAGHVNTPQRVQLLKGLLKRADEERQNRRRLQLLAVACQETAPTIPIEVQPALDVALERVVPPKGINEIGSLSQIGERLLDHLPEELAGLSSAQAEATVQTVALVNGEAALETLARYSADSRRGVQRALLSAWRYFDEVDYAKKVLADAPLVDGTLAVDDRTVKCLPYLNNLKRFRAELKNVSPETLTGLRLVDSLELLAKDSIDLAFIPKGDLRVLTIPYATGYQNISSLALASGLRSLTLTGRASIRSFSFLTELQDLEELSLRTSAKNTSLAAINSLPELKSLSLRHVVARGIDLSVLRSLVSLELRSMDCSLLETLPSGITLQSLTIAESQGSVDLRRLKESNISYLQLLNCGIVNLNYLSEVKGVEALSLVAIEGLDDLSVLNGLSDLIYVDIRGAGPELDIKSIARGGYRVVTDDSSVAAKIEAESGMKDRVVHAFEARGSGGAALYREIFRPPYLTFPLRYGRVG